MPQPSLSVHLSCGWTSAGAAAFRGNTVSASAVESGAPTLSWPADGLADQAKGGLTLIMTVLPPSIEGSEVASTLGYEPATWQGWAVTNMKSAAGDAEECAAGSGNVVIPYQLESDGSDYHHPMLR